MTCARNDLANTSVLIKVEFLANVETYTIVLTIPVSKTDKWEFDRHVCWAVLCSSAWSQTIRQCYETVHALAGIELCLYFVATAGRFAAWRRCASHHRQLNQPSDDIICK